MYVYCNILILNLTGTKITVLIFNSTFNSFFAFRISKMFSHGSLETCVLSPDVLDHVFMSRSCINLNICMCCLGTVSNFHVLSWLCLINVFVSHSIFCAFCIHFCTPATLYKWCTVASGTFKYVVPRLTCHHEGVPRASVLHLFCRMTNYEQVQNPGAVCMTRS